MSAPPATPDLSEYFLLSLWRNRWFKERGVKGVSRRMWLYGAHFGIIIELTRYMFDHCPAWPTYWPISSNRCPVDVIKTGILTSTRVPGWDRNSCIHPAPGLMQTYRPPHICWLFISAQGYEAQSSHGLRSRSEATPNKKSCCLRWVPCQRISPLPVTQSLSSSLSSSHHSTPLIFAFFSRGWNQGSS